MIWPLSMTVYMVLLFIGMLMYHYSFFCCLYVHCQVIQTKFKTVIFRTGWKSSCDVVSETTKATSSMQLNAFESTITCYFPTDIAIINNIQQLVQVQNLQMGEYIAIDSCKDIKYIKHSKRKYSKSYESSFIHPGLVKIPAQVILQEIILFTLIRK